jgi:hypothetical protein
MTTWSTSAVLAQTTNAQFQAWVNEVQNSLVTQVGLTQLAAAMDSGQMAVPSVTAVPVAGNASAGYYMFTFNDTLGQGPLVTGTALAALTAGTGYNGGASGTFTGVTLSGGTGTGAKATVVLGASGVVSSITPTTAGTGYNIADQLIVTSANMVAAGAAAGGGSSGFAFVNQLTSAASPVVIKLEFGSGTAAGDAQMYVTVGTSWTSNGVIGAAQNGAVTTRFSVLWGGAPVSLTTAYISRYCYNAANGFLGFVFKQGQVTAATPAAASGALFIYRASSNAGVPISNSVAVLTSGSSAASPGNNSSNGNAQCISYTSNLAYPTIVSPSNYVFWPAMNGQATPYAGETSSLAAGTVFVMPTYTVDPVWRFSAVLGIALIADIPLGVTPPPLAIIGAGTLTFLSVGQPFGAANGFATLASGQLLTILMLWM